MSKTIFHSGKALTSTWLNNSQYLGSSNKGVSFVSNPVNDWEYPLLEATSLNLPNFSQYFVSMTGNQSIDGTKTFTSIPAFPTSSQATGQQGVNIDRLNLDLATQTTSLTAQINSLSTTTTAALVALTADLNTNFVSITGNQTITGTKTFSSILVPTIPANLNSPISSQYYNNNTVVTNTNQTILGAKTFSNISVPLLPALDKSPISLQYFQDNAVIITGNQTIAGVKEFLDPRVPVAPSVSASPISLQHFTNNAVLKTGNQTIEGIKSFATPIVVPDAVNANQAINKSQLDALTQIVIGSGDRSGYFIVGSVLKFAWGQAGPVGAYDGTTTFANAIPGFPGFNSIPCLTVGPFGSYQAMFGLSALTVSGFSWSSRNLDNNRGIGFVDFIAIGV